MIIDAMGERQNKVRVPIWLIYAGCVLFIVGSIMIVGPFFGWFSNISILDGSLEDIFHIANSLITLAAVLIGAGLVGWAYNIFKKGNITIPHYLAIAVLLFFAAKLLYTSFKTVSPHPIGSKKVSYRVMFKYTSDTELPIDYPTDGAIYFAGETGFPSKRDVNRRNNGASGWSTTAWLSSKTQRAYACVAPNLVGYKDIEIEDGADINETIILSSAKAAELTFESPDDGVYDYNLEWDYDELELGVQIEGKPYPIESLCIIHMRVINGKNVGKILQEYEYNFQVKDGKIFVEDDKKMVFETSFDINELKKAELLVMGFTTKESGYIGFAAKGELVFRDNDNESK